MEPNTCGKRGQRLGARVLSNVVFRVHEFEQFRRCTQRLLKIVVKERELAYRIVKLEYRHDESEEGACGKDVMINLISSQEQQHCDGDRTEDIHQR